MTKQLCRTLLTSFCITLLMSCLAGAYDYPFTDPFAATVVGTPEEFSEKLPAHLPIKVDKIQMFPDREVPGKLWNFSELRYSYIRQNGPAPLIFLIAGTGASFNSAKMVSMQKAFYQAGYHVISLTSPTHPNFVVAASTSGVPGDLEEDSADLYKVMQMIWQKIGQKMEVTNFYLTGYSLGAANSAFVAKLDEQEKAFNFHKVLLINPPVSLYNSVLILDALLEENIPGGLDNFNAFYDRIINAFADVYAHGEGVEFNNDFLYKAYEYRKPTSDEPLKALIGMSFRLSSMNMAFATDVLTKSNYVVPKNLIIGRHSNTRIYSKVLSRLTFLDYFHDVLLPYAQTQNPQVTEPEMIKKLSLRRIEDYMRTSSKFGLIHNEDDIILLPGEIDYLRSVFGDRARIFPHGGHCGNMNYPDNVAAMIGFFQAFKQ